MSDIMDMLDDEENGRTYEGRFKKGHSGNPAGRPREDGKVNEKRQSNLEIALANTKVKPGPKKKKLNFEPNLDVQNVQESIEKNKVAFLNSIWEKIRDGDERLQAEMLKIVINKSQFGSDFSGLQDLKGVSIDSLTKVSDQLRKELGL